MKVGTHDIDLTPENPYYPINPYYVCKDCGLIIFIDTRGHYHISLKNEVKFNRIFPSDIMEVNCKDFIVEQIIK